MVTAMRRTAVILGLIFLAVLFQGGGAVAQDSGPTVADLKAAYCLRVIQDWDTRLCSAPLSDPFADVMKKGCHAEQTNLERLKGYLAARGYLSGEKYSTPALIAGDRASADDKDCGDSFELQKVCDSKCFARQPPPDKATCLKACPLADSCRRLGTCHDLSFLPF
jgi:hypothetical protein